MSPIHFWSAVRGSPGNRLTPKGHQAGRVSRRAGAGHIGFRLGQHQSAPSQTLTDIEASGRRQRTSVATSLTDEGPRPAAGPLRERIRAVEGVARRRTVHPQRRAPDVREREWGLRREGGFFA